MTYNTPQIRAAAVASELIEAKVRPGSDSSSTVSKNQVAPALEN